MSNTHPHALLVILFVAALGPFLNERPLRLRLPLVVLELLAGVVVGPDMLDLVAPEGTVRTLSALGLSFLFFLAGMHLDFAMLRGRPLNLGAAGWLLSMGVALSVAFALQAIGLVSDPGLVAVALSTTAIGTLMPILREAGELDKAFGRFVLGAGAIAEFGPIVLCTLLVTREEASFAQRSGYLVSFGFVTVALRLRPPHIVELLSRTLRRTSQLPIRLSMFVLGRSVVLANVLGLDLLLAAFAAGSLVGLVSRGPGAELFHHKLDALGFGFLIPIFFVVSGMQIDLRSLAEPGNLARAPLYLALLLFV